MRLDSTDSTHKTRSQEMNCKETCGNNFKYRNKGKESDDDVGKEMKSKETCGKY